MLQPDTISLSPNRLRLFGILDLRDAYVCPRVILYLNNPGFNRTTRDSTLGTPTAIYCGSADDTARH